MTEAKSAGVDKFAKYEYRGKGRPYSKSTVNPRRFLREIATVDDNPNQAKDNRVLDETGTTYSMVPSGVLGQSFATHQHHHHHSSFAARSHRTEPERSDRPAPRLSGFSIHMLRSRLNRP